MTMFETLKKVMVSGSTLKIQCGRCGHVHAWPREDAFKAYGPDAAPYDVRRRSRCLQCGERRKISVFI
jgi:hypothetical protein